MKRLRFFSLALLAACFSLSAHAYDFSAKNKAEVEIFYNINPGGNTLTVTYGANPYSATELEIPQEVTHDGKTYTVTAIGNRAFERGIIPSVILPATITEIQNYAFNQSNIANINYPKGLKRIGEYAFYFTNINNGLFPDGLEEIGQQAFDATKIDSLNLPNTLIVLGKNAFSQCRSLHTVKIPGSLKVIEKETFYACSNLYKVEIEEGVESLGVRPYDGGVFQASPIREISFPSSLTYIGPYCFSGNEFTELVLPNTIKELGANCFFNSPKLESITFSSGMTDLPNYVCQSCPKLIEVIIPEGIQKIGSMVFERDALLSHITLPESVTEVDNAAFSNTGLVDFIFPKSLTYISSRMFSSCNNLTELTIPETITEIRNGAFEHCKNLKKVTLPENLITLENSVFYSCSNLTEVNIPVSIGMVPSYLFQGCSNLKKMIIPEGITEIDRGAFQGCTNLAELELPKSLQIIREHLIGECDALRKLTIYHNVSLIEQHAFDECKTIEEIHLYRAVLPETPIPLGWLVDRPVIQEGNNCTLYVPKGSVESYKASFYWNTFKDIVEEEITEQLNYQITFPYSFNGGSVTVNGDPTKTVMEFAMGSDVEIAVSANEGYHLSSFFVNGKDATADLIDNIYSIKNIDCNYDIDAIFAENPVILSIYTAVGGSVDVEVEKNQSFSCIISAEEDWTINTVTFNGMDVTANLLDDNRYTTPALTANSELRITFENVNAGIDDISLLGSDVKVYVDNSGLVNIKGLEQGSLITVYSIEGQQIDSTISSGSSDYIQLSQHGVYLIKTPLKTYKVQY